MLSPITGTGTITGNAWDAAAATTGAGISLGMTDSEWAGISEADVLILYNGLPTLIYRGEKYRGEECKMSKGDR